MAIFSAGGAVGSISGKIGGLTFVNAKGSKVVRPSQRLVRPSAKKQQRASAVMTNQSRRWKDLSADERNAWRTYAAQVPAPNRLGVARFLSGFQMFMKINLQRFGHGLGATDLPPVLPNEPTVVNVTFAFSLTAGLEMSFGPPSGTQTNAGALYARPLYRTSTAQFSNTYSFIAYYADLPASPADLTSDYELVYASPVLNQAIALRWVSTAPDFNRAGPSYDQTVNVTA